MFEISKTMQICYNSYSLKEPAAEHGDRFVGRWWYVNLSNIGMGPKGAALASVTLRSPKMIAAIVRGELFIERVF